MAIYFNDTDKLNLNSTLILDQENTHYLFNVLRKKATDTITICNGRGIEYTAMILEINKNKTAVSIENIKKHKHNKPQLHIGISLLKNSNRLEWLFEKATELGVTSINPFISEHTEKQNLKTERFQNILISAMLQSQQYFLPILNSVCTLKELIQKTHNTKKRYFAYCGNEIPKNFIDKINFQDDSFFLIGAEGDFSKPEAAFLLENNVTPISLGTNRLRSETAGLFVCSYFYQLTQYQNL